MCADKILKNDENKRRDHCCCYQFLKIKNHLKNISLTISQFTLDFFPMSIIEIFDHFSYRFVLINVSFFNVNIMVSYHFYQFKLSSGHANLVSLMLITVRSGKTAFKSNITNMKFKIFAVLCCFLFAVSLAEEEDYDSRLDNLESLRYALPKLLDVSLSSERGYREANTLFKWNYGHCLVEIDHDIFDITKRHDKIDIHHGVAERFLKGFCKSFEKLSVAYNMIPLDKQKAIGNYINEYCSETLIEFKGKYIKEGAFDNMTKPFTKVEQVAFDGVWENIDSNTLALDELFPQLRVLNFTYPEGYILNRIFPKLEEFNADVSPSPALIKFLEKNSKIRKLSLTSTTVDVLRAVNKMPKLEKLSFHLPSDMESYQDDPVLHFGRIKDVSITANHDHHIEMGNITFKQLKKLQLSVRGELNDVWIDFIGKNKQLETLTITAGNLNNSTLSTLASKLNKIIEADLWCDNTTDTEGIVKFLESNPKINTLTLNFPKESVAYFNALTEKLSASKTLKNFEVAPVDKWFDSIKITNPSSSNGASYIFASSTFAITLITVVNFFASQ